MVRIAPRTTELLVQRGEYVPGQAVPLFELSPPVFEGVDFALSLTNVEDFTPDVEKVLNITERATPAP